MWSFEIQFKPKGEAPLHLHLLSHMASDLEVLSLAPKPRSYILTTCKRRQRECSVLTNNVASSAYCKTLAGNLQYLYICEFELTRLLRPRHTKWGRENNPVSHPFQEKQHCKTSIANNARENIFIKQTNPPTKRQPKAKLRQNRHKKVTIHAIKSFFLIKRD